MKPGLPSNAAFDDSMRAILSLAFGYKAFHMALLAMDAHGDSASADGLNQLRSEWESSGVAPDLSHENSYGKVTLSPTVEDFIQCCTGLIAAFDQARESREGAKLNLRHTVEALFELRAFARIAPKAESHQSVEAKAKWSQKLLIDFPVAASTLKKLNAAGIRTVHDLGKSDKEISALTGLSSAQIDKARDQVYAFIEHHARKNIFELCSFSSSRIKELLLVDTHFTEDDFEKLLTLASPKVKIRAICDVVDDLDQAKAAINSLLESLLILKDKPIDWETYPWAPPADPDETTYVSYSNAASFSNVAEIERPKVISAVRSFFEQNNLLSELDIVLFPPDNFSDLSVELSPSFWGSRSSSGFIFGLEALRDNLLQRQWSDWDRFYDLEDLLELIDERRS